MAIIIRKNKHSARVIRQIYVRKNTDKNIPPHINRQSLGRINLNATEVPEELKKVLSPDELARLIQVIVEPARKAKAAAEQEELNRQNDPYWRLRKAINLMDEAAKLTTSSLSATLGEEVRTSFSRLRFQQSGTAPLKAVNPIDQATQAVRLAKEEVKSGYFGLASDGVVKRDTVAYNSWMAFRAEALDGEDSLLAALQQEGWVKTAKRKI